MLYNYWYFVLATCFGLTLDHLQDNVLIVPLALERWPEDGLKKGRNVLPLQNTNNYVTLLCF
jgi:hypothetical protein